jgi:hypothetical protein
MFVFFVHTLVHTQIHTSAHSLTHLLSQTPYTCVRTLNKQTHSDSHSHMYITYIHAHVRIYLSHDVNFILFCAI